jgi:hypothetical protein
MSRPRRARALLLVLVGAPLALLAALHAIDARELAGFLSGSVVGGDLALLLGVAYVLAWFTSVLLLPIVVIAACLAPLHGMIARRMHTWRSSRAR